MPYPTYRNGIRGARHDPQAAFGQIPPLFTKSKSQDRKAPQPRYLPLARRRLEARTRGAVFQAPLTGASRRQPGTTPTSQVTPKRSTAEPKQGEKKVLAKGI